MIDIESLHVVFNAGDILESHALRGIDLTIKNGEFITVIGSNGAGKSTLLNALAGTVIPSSGRIMIEGKDISAQPNHRRAAMMARVFQDPLAGTCPLLTIEENMALALKRTARRRFRTAINATTRALFRDRLSVLNLNLENRLQDPVAKLSGGQRQALSLVMATLSESRILLLDEHTAALDPQMAEMIMQHTVNFISLYQLTVLMITHSMQSALDFGTRTIMLHKGKIAFNLDEAERQNMSIHDLMHIFFQTTSSTIDDDRLLLGAPK